MIVSVQLAFDSIRIYFGGALHFACKRSELFGIQSWRYGDNNYFIEYVSKDGATITCEYDDEVKWKTILAELEKLL